MKKEKTKIGKEFERLVYQKSDDPADSDWSLSTKGAPDNLIVLTKNYDCYIHYHASDSSSKKLWWGIYEDKINWLKNCKKKFSIVFLELAEKGNLLYDVKLDEFLRELNPPTKIGEYHVNENQLRSMNVRQFRTIDEFMLLLSSFAIKR